MGKSRLPESLVDRFFRANVGVVLLNTDNKIFVGERSDRLGCWQLPQGGIDAGESPRQAAFRELSEESGISEKKLAKVTEFRYEVPVWLGYELSKSSRDTKHGRGQVQKWFVFHFDGDDRLLDKGIKKSVEFANWKWMTLDEVVKAIWASKRIVYEELADHLRTHVLPE